jgi:hypothetical protein
MQGPPCICKATVLMNQLPGPSRPFSVKKEWKCVLETKEY